MKYIMINHQGEPDKFPAFRSEEMEDAEADFWWDSMQNTVDIDFQIWAQPVEEVGHCPKCCGVTYSDDTTVLQPRIVFAHLNNPDILSGGC